MVGGVTAAVAGYRCEDLADRVAIPTHQAYPTPRDHMGGISGARLAEAAPTMLARSLALLVFGAVASFAVPALAGSSSPSGTCDSMLIDLEDAQSTLSTLEDAVQKGQADRAALRLRASAIASAIEKAHAAGRDVSELQAQHEAVLADLAALEETAAIVASQLEALRGEVEASERAYITCVDASLS